MLRRLLRLLHLSMRGLIWLALLLVLMLGLLYGVTHVWLLPQVDQWRPALERELGAQLGRTVRIERLEASWYRLRLQVRVRQLRVLDRQHNPAAQLDLATGELSWWSLVRREPQFRRLQIQGFLVRLGRDRNGVWWLGDLPLQQTDGDSDLPDRLLRQDNVRFSAGQVYWQDALRGGQSLRLARVEFGYDRGLFQNDLSLSLVPLQLSREPWRASLSWRGPDRADWRRWHGHLQLRLPSTELQYLLPHLPGGLPALEGAVRGQVDAQFGRGRLLNGQFQLSGEHMQLMLPGALRALRVDQAHVQARLTDAGATQQLQFDTLQVQLPGAPLIPLEGVVATLHAAPARGELSVPRLAVATVRPLLLASGLPELTRLDPAGEVQALRLQWEGSLRSPRWQQLQASLRQLAVRPQGEWPGVSGLTGKVRISPGQLVFEPLPQAQPVSFDWPAQFAQPMKFDHVSGSLILHWTDAGQRLQLHELRARNADVQAQLQGEWQSDPAGPGRIDLQAELGPVAAAAARPWFPAMLGSDTQRWLQQAFADGQVEHTRLVVRGPLQQFPFTDGGGQFRVESRLRGMSLHYAAGWPDLQQVHGRLLFEGRSMLIEASSAQIDHLPVGPTVVRIDQLDAANPLLQVKGSVSGPTSGFLDFLQRSPLRATLGEVAAALDVVGNGDLDLELDIPLADATHTRVRGRYHFSANELRARGPVPAARGLTGTLEFSEQSVHLAPVSAETLGGRVSVQVSTDSAAVTAVDINGRVDARQAADFYQLPLRERVRGSSNWRLLLRLPASTTPAMDRGPDVQLSGNLQGVEVQLPAPLGKTAASRWPMRLELRWQDAGRQQWQLRGDTLAATLITRAGQLERGEVRFGARDLPLAQRSGLWLSGRLPWLQVDEISAVLAGSSAAGGSASLRGLDLQMDGLVWRGRRWNALRLQGEPGPAGWSGSVHSPHIKGDWAWRPEGHGQLRAVLDYLRVPTAGATSTDSPPAAAAEPALADVSRWPAVDLSAAQLVYEGREMGRLQLRAAPDARGYQVQQLQVLAADGEAQAQLSWQHDGKQWMGLLQLDSRCSDCGRWAQRWGQPDLLRRGDGRLRAHLYWRSGGLAPPLSGLSGSITVKLQRGTLLQVNPGMGRLLGLLNIENVLRRVRLDFKDVLSEGLAFDQIDGQARIQSGLLQIAQLQLKGPAVAISSSGTVSLDSGLLQLRVRVEPSLSGGVAVAGAVVNPVVGLSLLVLQQALSNPVGKMLTYTYNIGGSWQSPQVRELDQAPPPAGGN